MSRCDLCVRFKVVILLRAENIPSEYWNNRILLMSFKTQFFSKFFQGTKRLINQFLLFKYSCVYISVTKRNSEKIFNFVEGAWLALACVQVSKLQSFHGARKSFEYWKNRILLMSLKARFSSWFFHVAKSSLTNSYCFNIHAFTSQWKKGIPGKV